MILWIRTIFPILKAFEFGRPRHSFLSRSSFSFRLIWLISQCYFIGRIDRVDRIDYRLLQWTFQTFLHTFFRLQRLRSFFVKRLQSLWYHLWSASRIFGLLDLCRNGNLRRLCKVCFITRAYHMLCMINRVTVLRIFLDKLWLLWFTLVIVFIILVIDFFILFLLHPLSLLLYILLNILLLL